MGQEVPQNYGRWVFATPLDKEDEFDPALDSIFGVTAGSSHEREASAQSNEPMRNLYEQPSSRRGRSCEREEPQDPWEQQHSSSGSPEPPQDDPMGEEVVDLWEAEDPPDDDDDDDDSVAEQATRSSISASNPWVLYEAGIICAREEDGEIIKNSTGENVIVLREWNCLLTPQEIALRRQSIGRADWEKLPWTGHLCFLFTRAWEIGRMLTLAKMEGRIESMKNFLDNCRLFWTDRGQVPPHGWDERFDIDTKTGRESFSLYERDLAIQSDLEYLTETVFVFYTKHLDKFIRENDKLWGDFCKRRVDREGNFLEELELDTRSYDMTIPGIQVPMNKKTIIPEPEMHFSFSTKLMVTAIDLYEEEAPSSFCHFTTFALKKLRQFVDSRKEMTAQSYRFFVEHAYNQFFQHEAGSISSICHSKNQGERACYR